jgi:hypothetical protein
MITTIINLSKDKMTEIPTDQGISKPVNVVVVNTPVQILIREYDDCIDIYIQKGEK